MVRILVVDDHAIVREGLKRIVSNVTDIVVTCEASNGEEAIHKVSKNYCDVVLLDITMPKLSGVETLKQIKSLMPQIPVLMLSVHSEEQYAVRAIKAGASGYLTKESAPEELVTAIRNVASGEKYISSGLAARLADELASDRKQSESALSDREYEVMRMLASGKTVGEIAREMFLSTKTISTYRYRLLRKMGLANNAQLIHAFRDDSTESKDRQLALIPNSHAKDAAPLK